LVVSNRRFGTNFPSYFQG